MAEPDDDPTITLHLEADIELKVSEVWPDGPPAEIDAFAVKDRMEAGGHKLKVLKDWNLLDDLAVDIDVTMVNPAYRGDDALPGIEPPSPTIHSWAEVWG